MTISGKVLKFGKNIDTEAMFPGKYLGEFDPAEVAKHAMEGIDPGFGARMKPGDIIVAGPNFGCGSAREQAAMTLKFAGLGAIVADSFARAFYRNAINNALPVIALAGVSGLIAEGEVLEIDIETGTIVDRTSGLSLQAAPAPAFVVGIIDAGGAIPYYRRLMDQARAADEAKSQGGI